MQSLKEESYDMAGNRGDDGVQDSGGDLAESHRSAVSIVELSQCVRLGQFGVHGLGVCDSCISSGLP